MRLFVGLLISSLFAYVLGAFLTLVANPEVRFWSEVIQQREARINALQGAEANTPMIIFTGGSSCAFSIDPEVIESEVGIPAVNVGLPVSCGGHYIVHQALAKARAGDFLVICLEPDLLTYSGELEPQLTASGYAIAAAQGRPNDGAGGETFQGVASLGEHLAYLRPGARFLTVFSARLLSGKPYRYNNEDIRFGGRLETPIANESKPVGLKPSAALAPEGRAFLSTIAKVAETRGVHVGYSMPWHLTDPEFVETNRRNKRMVLDDIATIMPVLCDGYLGTMDDPRMFSDSSLHLTSEGSTTRSRALGRDLKRWVLAVNQDLKQ